MPKLLPLKNIQYKSDVSGSIVTKIKIIQPKRWVCCQIEGHTIYILKPRAPELLSEARSDVQNLQNPDIELCRAQLVNQISQYKYLHHWINRLDRDELIRSK